MQMNKKSYRKLPYLITLLMIASSCKFKPKYPGPLTPEGSMKTFHFADKGLKAELFASEPLVKDPIYMVFDNKGNAYVVEMADANMPDSLTGHCKIVYLEDRNGDGRADTAIVFAHGLKDATSILPWKGGLIVTAAPYILYMKDTTGDHKVDVIDTLFTGFFTHNDEAQITSLQFSIDNWIYANNYGEAGIVHFDKNPSDSSLNSLGADFRFRLDRNEFGLTAGPGQFGQAIDNWGHRFVTENTIHIRQIVIPWRYLHRNPLMPQDARRAIKNISDHDPIMYQLSKTPYWRQIRTEMRNQESKDHGRPPTEYASDHFTGASGGTFFGGWGLGKRYYGSIFTGDVSGNLVHRDKLILATNPKNPFYTATRGNEEQKGEFIAATDEWFRPTSFATGPDGYLYITDMYRQHIENPTSIPLDLRREMNFRAGMNKGRIYRIVPANTVSYKKPIFDLDTMSSLGLVHLLSNPNRWFQLRAHMLLIERQDKSIIPEVKSLLQTSQKASVRIQALYVLEGLDVLDTQIVNNALRDPAPGIRENAAKLSERFPSCLPYLEKLITDSSAMVAFQATLSLGQFSGDRIVNDLIDILKRYGTSSWFREAVLSSVPGSSEAMLKALTTKDSFLNHEDWATGFLQDIGYIIGGRNNNKEVSSLLDLPLLKENSGNGPIILAGLLTGLSNGDKSDTTIVQKLANIQTTLENNPAAALQALKRLY